MSMMWCAMLTRQDDQRNDVTARCMGIHVCHGSLAGIIILVTIPSVIR